MTQRNGRIIRQGNMNKEVKVFNYVTEGTFDSYLFQTLENKQRFISQIMTSKSPVRSCEDVDEQALSYAEIKALCAGNPLIKEKMDLDVQVAKLKVLKADHQSQKFRLQDKLLTKFPADIQETNAHIAGLKADAQLAAAHPQGKEEFCDMVIKGVTYDEKKTAGEQLVLACSELPNAEEKVIGSYRGFELSLRFDTYRSEYQAILKGQRKYTVPLGTDPLGNITRLDNSLNNFPERITAAENELDTLHQQQAAAQIEVEKPLPTGRRTGREVRSSCGTERPVGRGRKEPRIGTGGGRTGECPSPPLGAGSTGRKIGQAGAGEALPQLLRQGW